MSTAIELFTYEAQDVRTVVIDGDVWFVATDVAAVLEYRMASDMVRALDERDKGYADVRTPGGEQQMLVINESGLYDAVFRSRTERARDFRHWVTSEVIPAIRRGGSYSTAPALTDDELIHRALTVSARRVAELTERVAELEPQAAVATKLLDAEGDLSVRDAAQSLTRAGLKLGAGRLFTLLETKRWIRRAAGDGRYRVMQYAIERGYMSVLPQSHYHPKTGELVLDPPQPRVTPKGLQKLLADYGGFDA